MPAKLTSVKMPAGLFAAWPGTKGWYFLGELQHRTAAPV
jgi:hypothetical protein